MNHVYLGAWGIERKQVRDSKVKSFLTQLRGHLCIAFSGIFILAAALLQLYYTSLPRYWPLHHSISCLFLWQISSHSHPGLRFPFDISESPHVTLCLRFETSNSYRSSISEIRRGYERPGLSQAARIFRVATNYSQCLEFIPTMPLLFSHGNSAMLIMRIRTVYQSQKYREESSKLFANHSWLYLCMNNMSTWFTTIHWQNVQELLTIYTMLRVSKPTVFFFLHHYQTTSSEYHIHRLPHTQASHANQTPLQPPQKTPTKTSLSTPIPQTCAVGKPEPAPKAAVNPLASKP